MQQIELQKQKERELAERRANESKVEEREQKPTEVQDEDTQSAKCNCPHSVSGSPIQNAEFQIEDKLHGSDDEEYLCEEHQAEKNATAAAVKKAYVPAKAPRYAMPNKSHD